MNDFSCSAKPLVCFFDSGIGGLTLLYESVKKIKEARFAYFADNFNVPYGRYSHEELLSVTDGVFSVIKDYNPTAVVIACNTVTAHCAEFLRGKYNFPIIGIQPAVKPASIGVEKCLVLATSATVHSRALSDLVTHYGNGVTQIEACPNLASYIEENVFDLREDEVFSLLPKANANSVVLGCTHYIFVKEKISEFYGGCPVFDGVDGTVNRLLSVLGTGDHFSANSGQNLNAGEGSTVQNRVDVWFIGGNTSKNARIFNSMFCN